MTQVKFAEAMELRPETVSRWENDLPGVGGSCEKLVRHNVCALLYKEAKGRPYDPAVITHMRIMEVPDGTTPPLIEMVRVRLDNDAAETDGWNESGRRAA